MDGLDKNWERGNKSNWEREYNSRKIHSKTVEIPFAIQKLNREIRIKNDKRFVSRRNTNVSIAEQCQKYTKEGKRIAKKCHCHYFKIVWLIILIFVLRTIILCGRIA